MERIKLRLGHKGGLQSNDCVLIKTGNMDTVTQKKGNVKTQGEFHLQAKKCLELPEAKREDENRFSLTVLRRNQPCQYVDLRASRAMRQ